MASKFGMTPQGFVLKRYEDIRSSLITRLKTAFGNIATADESVFGQLIAIISETDAEVWELGESTYYSQYVRSASGVNLDYAVENMGISRLSATHSSVSAVVFGVPGNTIPAGFVAKVKGTNDLFQTNTSKHIDGTSVYSCQVSILEAHVGHVYSILLDGVAYTYTAVSGDTTDDIMQGLCSAVSMVLANDVTWMVSYVNGDDFFTVQTKTFGVAFTVTPGQYVSTPLIGVTVNMLALQAGTVQAVNNTLAVIVTPVSGIKSILNPQDAQAGRATESDDALRVRYFASLGIAGKSTLEGIRASLLQNVPGVTAVSMQENIYGDTLNGMPPNSIKAVVVGGLDQDIREMLWITKAGGIQTVGNTSGLVVDSQGDNHTVCFSRPVTVYLWLKVNAIRYGEEQLPAGVVEMIQAEMVSVAATQTMGKDVITQRYASRVVNIAGIGSCVVSAALTLLATDGKPADNLYTVHNISIDADTMAAS